MIRALLYLQFHSVRNRLGARLRRLKRPKYLAGAIFGALYFIFYFSSILGGLGGHNPSAQVLNLANGDLELIGAALLLLVMALWWTLGWIFPNERTSLAFSEAEIAFLFQAPISRRNLIRYKLARSQLGILFSTLLLTIIRGRWLLGGHVLFFALGWWLILSTLNLNFLAESFARTLLFERGLMTRWRRVLILSAVAAVFGAIVYASWANLPTPPPDNAHFTDVLAWARNVLTTGALPWVLYPFQLVVRPLFAQNAAAFLVALGPALLILAAHYFIVMRADVAFEEASIEYSRKLVTRLDTLRQRQGGVLGAPRKARRSPFKLRPTGPPAVAFLWKNLILAGRFFSVRTLALLGWLIFIAVTIVTANPNHSSGQNVFGLLCLVLAMLSVFMGPLLLRADFRADLPNAELLLLYPMPGWQIVLGEVLAPVVILTAVQWVLIALAAIFIAPGEGTTTLQKVVAAVAVGLLVPAVNLVILLIPNAMALLLPSWVRFDKNAPRGFETIGQNIIMALGTVLVMFCVMLPAGLAMGGVFMLGLWLLSPAPAMLLAALAGAVVVATETGVAIYFLGHAFERFDVSGEMTN